ncbi:hypothetical protein FF1_028056 [Malus domestica]
MDSRRSCFALTSIKGIGRRFANIVCKKADVDMNKRAGELFATELDNLMTIVANPHQFKIQGCFSGSQFPNGYYNRSWNHEHPDDDLGFLPLVTKSSQAVWDTNRPLQVVGLGCYSHVVFDITGALRG